MTQAVSAERLKNFMGAEWAEWLGPWFKSKHWEQLQQELQKRRSLGETLVPLPKNIFRAFKECPFYSMHTIILNDSCYPMLGIDKVPIADGIAFSAKDSLFCPIPLEKVLYALDDAYYGIATTDIISDTDDYDLRRWTNQGILMINCCMTAKAEEDTDEHLKLWEPFIVYLLDRLDYWKENLNVIAMGETSRKFAGIFGNPSHKIQYCESPNQATKERRNWEHENVLEQLKIDLAYQNIQMKW